MFSSKEKLEEYLLGGSSGVKTSSAPKTRDEAKKADRNEDITQADADMSPVQGMDFAAESLPARMRNKPSGFRRLLSAIGGFFANAAAFPLGIFRKLQRWSRRRRNQEQARAGNRNTIPGWEGAEFEKPFHLDREPEIDFRKVPDVWSYLTAEEPLDQDGKPRPSQISVYVREPEQNADGMEEQNADEGSTGIGIEYTRYSQSSGRWERYNLRYGFYMAGGLSDGASKAALRWQQATVPGRLQDDSGKPYTISRSYPATAKQVNDVLKASRSYADKGYNLYTRNNTSFARSMLLDVARVPGGKEIFDREDRRPGFSGQAKAFAASKIGLPSETRMETNLNKLITEDDMDYANYGNKRMSADEYKNYDQSISGFTPLPLEVDSPGAVGQNIRRLQGKDVGTLGSSKGIVTEEDGSVNLFAARYWLREEGKLLRLKLDDLIPADFVRDRMPAEFSQILESLKDLGKPIDDFTYENESHSRRSPEEFSRDKLRWMRSELSKNAINLNKLLFRYYKNDARIQPQVLRLLSIMNEAMTGLDVAYIRTTNRAENNGVDQTDLDKGDLGDLRQQLYKNSYRISFSGLNVHMTPSLYEAYLQIYKTPKKVIAEYSNYTRLANLAGRGRALEGDDKKDYEKYQRIQKLAADFDRSHRYMLEKNRFSQQDIDYAFNLEKLEKQKGVSSDMEDQDLYASQIYKSLFLENIFDGMKERFTRFIKNLPEDAGMPEVEQWVEDELAKYIDVKEEEITGIIWGLVKTLDIPNLNEPEKLILSKIKCMIEFNWLRRLFRADGEKDLAEILEESWSAHRGGKVDKVLKPFIKRVLNEYGGIADERRQTLDFGL